MVLALTIAGPLPGAPGRVTMTTALGLTRLRAVALPTTTTEALRAPIPVALAEVPGLASLA